MLPGDFRTWIHDAVRRRRYAQISSVEPATLCRMGKNGAPKFAKVLLRNGTSSLVAGANAGARKTKFENTEDADRLLFSL